MQVLTKCSSFNGSSKHVGHCFVEATGEIVLSSLWGPDSVNSLQCLLFGMYCCACCCQMRGLQVCLPDLQVQTSGGTVLKAAAADFPVSQEMSGALVQFQPGALRQAS